MPPFIHEAGVTLDYKLRPTTATNATTAVRYTFPNAAMKRSMFADLFSIVSDDSQVHTVSETANFMMMMPVVRAVDTGATGGGGGSGLGSRFRSRPY